MAELGVEVKGLRRGVFRRGANHENENGAGDSHRRRFIACSFTNWSGRGDSNARPSPWQGDALPLSYARAPRKRLSQDPRIRVKARLIGEVRSARQALLRTRLRRNCPHPGNRSARLTLRRVRRSAFLWLGVVFRSGDLGGDLAKPGAGPAGSARRAPRAPSLSAGPSGSPRPGARRRRSDRRCGTSPAPGRRIRRPGPGGSGREWRRPGPCARSRAWPPSSGSP